MSLTTRNRVKTKLGITVTTYDSVIDGWLDPVSNLIDEYCNRIFATTDYKVWLNGEGSSELFLPQYPINNVDRVSIHKVYVAQVQCAVSGATKAYITIDDTEVKFDHIDSAGARQSTSLAFATYATLSAMAAAAPAGWTVTVQSGYGTWPTTDLVRVQSADCITPVNFQMEMADEEIGVELGRYDNGLIMAIDNVFPGGRKNIYIEYNAGYTEPVDGGVSGNVPAGLESVAIEAVWNGVKGLNRQSDPTMKSKKIGDYSWTRKDNGEILLSDNLKSQLDPWKNIIL